MSCPNILVLGTKIKNEKMGLIPGQFTDKLINVIVIQNFVGKCFEAASVELVLR